jgi:hypothetical protein
MAGYQDPQTLADQITQQQHLALADAIRKQSMVQSPTEYAAGGRAVEQSPLIGLSKLGQALIANRMDKSNAAERLTDAQAAQDRQNKAFAKIFGNGQAPTTPVNSPVDTQSTSNTSGNGQASSQYSLSPPAQDLSLNLNNQPKPQALAQALQAQQPQQPVQTGSKNPMALFDSPEQNATAMQYFPDQYVTAAFKNNEKTELAKELDLLHNTTNPADRAIVQNKIAPPVVNRGYGLLTTNPLTGHLENNDASMQGITLAKQREADVANANTLVTKKNEQGKEVTKTQEQWLKEANSGAGVVTGAGTVQQKLQEEQGQSAATQEDKINLDAETALGKMANNKQMRSLLPSLTTGAFAKQVTAAKSVLQSMGITPTDDSGNIIDPSTNQEFEKYAIKGALESAKQIYGSRLTNQDVENQLKSNPGSTMSQKAMYQILKNDDLLQQRKLDAQHAYFNEYKGPPNQFQMWFDQRHPLNGLTAPTASKPAAETAYSPPIPDLTQAPVIKKNPKLSSNPDGSFNYQH